MKTEQLNRLLNTACKIITQLEHNADAEQAKKINAMFDEIKYADKIDEEMKDSSPSLLWSDGQDLCDSLDDDLCSVMDKHIKKGFVSEKGELFFDDDDIVNEFNSHLMGLQRLIIDTYDIPYSIVPTEHEYDGKTYLGNAFDFSNDAGVKADLEAQDHDLFGEDKV